MSPENTSANAMAIVMSKIRAEVGVISLKFTLKTVEFSCKSPRKVLGFSLKEICSEVVGDLTGQMS